MRPRSVPQSGSGDDHFVLGGLEDDWVLVVGHVGEVTNHKQKGSTFVELASRDLRIVLLPAAGAARCVAHASDEELGGLVRCWRIVRTRRRLHEPATEMR